MMLKRAGCGHDPEGIGNTPPGSLTVECPACPHPGRMLLYYFPSHFLLIITSFTDALYASLFVIVYSYSYTIQSPNTALLSCLLRTLGIVIHLYTQYIQLLISDSSCLISCYSCTQPCSSVLQRYINVPRNRLWTPASRRITNIIFNYNVQFNSNLR